MSPDHRTAEGGAINDREAELDRRFRAAVSAARSENPCAPDEPVRKGYPYTAADCLELFALVDAREQKAATSASLLGAADALRMRIGAERPELERRTYDEAVELARSRLGKKSFEHNWEQGGRLPLSDVVALSAAPAPNHARLSTRLDCL